MTIRNLVGFVATAIVFIVAILLGRVLWVHYMDEPWTRDGRVRAEIVNVAPDVSGAVVELPVKDNQLVRKGDLLMQIDPSHYEIAVEQAQAAVAARKAELQMKRDDARRRADMDSLVVSKESQENAAHTASAAEAAYRRLLATDPKSAQANAGLAHVLIVRKQFPEAEKLIRTALAQSPDDPVLGAQLATVLAAQDNAEALPLLQKLHAAHPQDAAITRMLADVLADAGDAAGSDKLYVALLAADPDDIALLVAHGQNLIRQLKYVEAAAAFEKATKLDSANGDAWSGLAFAASKLHQPSVTIHALTMRSKYMPEVPATYFLWATSYDTLNDKVAAATYYHHFLDSSGGKFPDQEWQARQRLLILEKNK